MRKVLTHRPLPPYDFSTHLSVFSIKGEPLPHIYDKVRRACRNLLFVGGEHVPVEAVFSGEPWEPRITVTVWSGNEGVAEEAFRQVLERVRASFDYSAFIARLAGWPRLKSLALKYAGVRPGRFLSLYEALVDTVIKQRIALKAALRIQARLVRAFGRKVVMEGREFYSFPEPEALARAAPDKVRALGLTRAKARTIREIAAAALEGRLPSLGDAVKDPWGTAKELTKLWGVGDWTAELAVAQVHPLFPIGPRTDLAVRRGLARVMGEGSEGAVERVIDLLGDFAGLVMYLAALDYEMSKGRR